MIAESRRVCLAYIELIALHVPQVQGDRLLPSIHIVDKADAVGGQVDLPVLLVGELVLPIHILRVSHSLAILLPCHHASSHGSKGHTTLTPHRAPRCPGQREGPHLEDTKAGALLSSRSALETSVISLGRPSRLPWRVFACCNAKSPKRLLAELRNDKAG